MRALPSAASPAIAGEKVAPARRKARSAVVRLTRCFFTGRALAKGERVVRSELTGVEAATVFTVNFDQNHRAAVGLALDDMAKVGDLARVLHPNVFRDDGLPIIVGQRRIMRNRG